RQELFDLACTAYNDAVFFRQFVNTENGNDVLEFFVLLQDLLDASCDIVVFLTNILWVEQTRGRCQWVNRWVETTRGQVTCQVGGCIEVSEHVGWCRVGVVVRWDVDGLH